MLHSDKFVQTTIAFDGSDYPMEFDLSIINAEKGQVSCFGNIYFDADKEPMQFTYFTIGNQIGGYTPMNGKKEFISSIVEATLGEKLPFTDIAGL